MEKNKNLLKLSQRLAWARSEKGWTQQELADIAKVSQGTIGNLESGARDTSRKITSIAKALGVNLYWLVDGTGTPTDDGAPIQDQVVANPPPPRNAHTQWIGDDEADILDAYRTTDTEGRKSIKIAAASVTKFRISGVVDHKT